MSYSLPFIPAKLLRHPNNKEKLKQLQYEISLCKTLLTNLRVALVDNIAKLNVYENHPNIPQEYEKYMHEIRQRIPNSFYQRAMSHIGSTKQADISEQVN